MARLNEFELIHQLTSKQQSRKFFDRQGVVTGVGDDAAVVKSSPHTQLVACCDTMVEEVHFNRWTMLDEDIGYKAMAVNVSDIVAMGAKPKHALISISIPKTYSAQRVKRIYKGLYACADRYRISVIGGDTTSAPRHASITLTLLGEVESDRALLRSAAQPGDVVFITGFPGCSAAGLHYLQQEKVSRLQLEHIPEPMRDLVQAHRRPQPSVEAGELLRSNGCHALNDISDGIASEAWEIAEASQVEIVLEQSRIPIAPQLAAYANQQSVLQANDNQLKASEVGMLADDDRRNYAALEWALYGGEDYCLLGTIAKASMPMLKNDFQQAGLSIYAIGEVTTKGKSNVYLQDSTGSGARKEIPKNGYQHFK